MTAAALSVLEAAPEFTFVGNIVVSRGAALRFWKEGSKPDWVGARHNLYPAGSRFLRPEGALDLAARLKLGLDAGSLEADPRLAGRGDFSPRPGSPAIDAGPVDGAPSRDAAGRMRPRGKAPDLGAFESP